MQAGIFERVVSGGQRDCNRGQVYQCGVSISCRELSSETDFMAYLSVGRGTWKEEISSEEIWVS